MPTYKIAHIRQQGVDLIVVPLASAFGAEPAAQQEATIVELQARASAAGLAGTVVPVWEVGRRQMKFIAPQNWHPFFRSLSMAAVFHNVNKQLRW